jgi:hypothetical protein
MKTWDRVGPVLGIVSWIVIVTGFVIHGYPTMDASAQDLVRWASSTDIILVRMQKSSFRPAITPRRSPSFVWGTAVL